MARHEGDHQGSGDPRKERGGTEPLLTAKEVQAGLRIDSFWGRRVSLDELVLQEPHVHIRVEKERYDKRACASAAYFYK